MQYSLKTLLLVFTAVAACLFSLLYANPLIGDVFYSIAIGTSAVALLISVQLRGKSQAYWVGFLLISTLYLWFTMVDNSVESRAATVRSSGRIVGSISPKRGSLITEPLLAWAYEEFCLSKGSAGSFPNAGVGNQGALGQQIQLIMLQQADPNYQGFLAVGHSSVALLLGWLGGVFSSRMYRLRVGQAGGSFL
jgi:hypothetical protein